VNIKRIARNIGWLAFGFFLGVVATFAFAYWIAG